MPAVWIGLGTAAIGAASGVAKGMPSMMQQEVPISSAFDSSNWNVNIGSGSQTNKQTSSTDAKSAGSQPSGAGGGLGFSVNRDLIVIALIVGAAWYFSKKK